MRSQEQGRDEGNYGGFSVPESGTYDVEIAEGIDLFTFDDGEMAGRQALVIPTKIESDCDNNGLGITVFPIIPNDEDIQRARDKGYLPRGEQIMADILVQTGMSDNFDKAFKDEGYFDDVVIDKYKVKLPGCKLNVTGERYKNKAGYDKFKVTAIRKYGGAQPKQANTPKKEEAFDF